MVMGIFRFDRSIGVCARARTRVCLCVYAQSMRLQWNSKIPRTRNDKSGALKCSCGLSCRPFMCALDGNDKAGPIKSSPKRAN